MARVVINDVSKAFAAKNGETVCAVRGISLDIAEREFLAIVGPSGCGKTTTLRIIAGLETADSGTLLLDGVSMNGVPPKDRDVAMVFQSHALFPHLTAYENMAFGLMLRKFPKMEIDKRVRAAAEALGLSSLLARKPQNLSGGECQRVALGRAMVRRPKVFLFDEPLSNLDAPMRLQLRGEIAKLRQQVEASFIYVTHDQSEALALADRIAVMRNGMIEQVAAPAELTHRPASPFVANFMSFSTP